MKGFNVRRIVPWSLLFLVLLTREGSAVKESDPKNVLGTKLIACGKTKPTGFYRDGFCVSGPDDHGVHVVCAEVTDDFLNFSKSKGNDLITPHIQFDFPGLKAGDRWCLCAARWKEAFDAGHAPPVVLDATAAKAVTITTLDALKSRELGR